MSGYRGHIAGAGLFGAGYLGLLSTVFSINLLAYNGAHLKGWQYIIALLVLAVSFGIWPDVDTNSIAQNIFFAGLFVINIILILNHRLEASAYLGLIAMLPILGKHRGWTHSFIAMFLVPLPLVLGPYLFNPGNWYYALTYYGAGVVGYFSHLFFDGRISRFMRRYRHGHW